MATKYYLGIVEKDADSAYGIEALESNGRAVPTLRSIGDVMRDEEVRKAITRGAMTMLVPS